LKSVSAGRAAQESGLLLLLLFPHTGAVTSSLLYVRLLRRFHALYLVFHALSILCLRRFFFVIPLSVLRPTISRPKAAAPRRSLPAGESEDSCIQRTSFSRRGLRISLPSSVRNSSRAVLYGCGCVCCLECRRIHHSGLLYCSLGEQPAPWLLESKKHTDVVLGFAPCRRETLFFEL